MFIYKNKTQENKIPFKEALSKSDLTKMAKNILKSGTEPEYLFAVDNSSISESEQWIQEVGKNSKFSYAHDMEPLFEIYNKMWMDSF